MFVENCQMDSPHLERVLRFKSNAKRGGVLEKWKLLRQGLSAEDATQRVGTRLASRTEKKRKPRLSKKAKSKAQAAAAS